MIADADLKDRDEENACRQMHQENLAAALHYFIENNEDAENGIIIWVGENQTPLRGKLVFEIEGKLPLEEAYRKKMERLRNKS